ncbi:hypothetical protein GOBAR_DD35596 [Gossypium barbadense]|nr:hypothetical protein GOBAR_DD35596 [Gossypium barbadense]
MESWELFLTNLLRSVYYIRHIAANFYRDYKNVNWQRQVVRMAHELEPLFQRITRLESDMEGPMELIFEIDDAIAGGSKHFIIHVPLTTFELFPNKKGLCKNLKGRLQSSRIRSEMDIQEKSNGKHCGLCRLVGHNRSKCPQQNYHIGQSLRSGRN